MVRLDAAKSTAFNNPADQLIIPVNTGMGQHRRSASLGNPVASQLWRDARRRYKSRCAFCQILAERIAHVRSRTKTHQLIGNMRTAHALIRLQLTTDSRHHLIKSYIDSQRLQLGNNSLVPLRAGIPLLRKPG
ncbi:hypothetical protein D3C75_1039250 [compost metagenome]